MHRPPLGQHFLRDPRAVETILQAAELDPADSVLEIGPGKGVLTTHLVDRVERLVVVELDRVLAPRLQELYGSRPGFTLIHQDFLKTDLRGIFPATPEAKPIKVLGNLPYSITSPIIEKVLVWPGWDVAVFLVQREVGERMCSAPGSKTFGILSLAVQLFAKVESIGKVKPGAFSPPPQVMSQIIRLRRRKELPLAENRVPDFFDLAHGAFAHRRKTLANSLALHSDAPRSKVEVWLREHQVDPSVRAETLGLEHYVRLAEAWGFFRREMNLT
jgi:16S rRNA (adenine1518-N6/adenine1519-N6)-dimethyltransferase